jgi:hypothetical protein
MTISMTIREADGHFNLREIQYTYVHVHLMRGANIAGLLFSYEAVHD